jgi:phosphoribosylanthranilate isomerase
MSLWIKICANTSLDDALLAADAGANALGFVFAPSPRRVTIEQAAAIVAHLPAEVEKIGVFVDASLDEVTAAVEGAGLTGVQLHFDIATDFSARLRERFGKPLRILRVVHFADEDLQHAGALSDPHADGILVDSRTASAVGGTGIVFDWNAARRGLFSNAGERKLIAAGGLSSENVTEAIAKLQPWGVDVVSGVELSPGRKDAAKVRAFIANARAAVKAENAE